MIQKKIEEYTKLNINSPKTHKILSPRSKHKHYYESTNIKLLTKLNIHWK